MRFEMPPNRADIDPGDIDQVILIDPGGAVLSEVCDKPLDPNGQNIGIPIRPASFATSQSGRDRLFASGIKSDVLRLGVLGLARGQAIDAGGEHADIELAVERLVSFDHRVEHCFSRVRHGERKITAVRRSCLPNFGQGSKIFFDEYSFHYLTAG